jgi:hypothetical protein
VREELKGALHMADQCYLIEYLARLLPRLRVHRAPTLKSPLVSSSPPVPSPLHAMCDLVTLFLVVVTKTFESPPQLYEVQGSWSI